MFFKNIYYVNFNGLTQKYIDKLTLKEIQKLIDEKKITVYELNPIDAINFNRCMAN